MHKLLLSQMACLYQDLEYGASFHVTATKADNDDDADISYSFVSSSKLFVIYIRFLMVIVMLVKS